MYKSQAQEKFFHTNSAKKAGITSSEVKEFDKASKGKVLPKRVSRHKVKIKSSHFKEA